MELALIPIGLIPGTGLLILSTSSRYWIVVSELRTMAPEDCATALGVLEMRRARLFRNALVGLYVAVALASTSALLGSVWNLLRAGGGALAAVGTAMAIGCLVYASVQLIQESILSLQQVQQHARQRGESRD